MREVLDYAAPPRRRRQTALALAIIAGALGVAAALTIVSWQNARRAARSAFRATAPVRRITITGQAPLIALPSAADAQAAAQFPRAIGTAELSVIVPQTPRLGDRFDVQVTVPPDAPAAEYRIEPLRLRHWNVRGFELLVGGPVDQPRSSRRGSGLIHAGARVVRPLAADPTSQPSIGP